jgi:hypothetical protein
VLSEIPLGLLENDGGPSEDILFAPVPANSDVQLKAFEGPSLPSPPKQHPHTKRNALTSLTPQGVAVRPEKEGTPRTKVSYVRWNDDGYPLGKLGVPLGHSSLVYHFPTVFRTSLDVAPTARCPVFPSTSGDCGSAGITKDACTKAGCCYYPSQVLNSTEMADGGPLPFAANPSTNWVGADEDCGEEVEGGGGDHTSIDLHVSQQNHSGCHFHSDVTAQALRDFQFVWKNRDTLLGTHTAAWTKMWSSRIEIEGTYPYN